MPYMDGMGFGAMIARVPGVYKLYKLCNWGKCMESSVWFASDPV